MKKILLMTSLFLTTSAFAELRPIPEKELDAFKREAHTAIINLFVNQSTNCTNYLNPDRKLSEIDYSLALNAVLYADSVQEDVGSNPPKFIFTSTYQAMLGGDKSQSSLTMYTDERISMVKSIDMEKVNSTVSTVNEGNLRHPRYVEKVVSQMSLKFGCHLP